MDGSLAKRRKENHPLHFLIYMANLLPFLLVAVLLRLLINWPRRSFRKRTTILHEVGVIGWMLYVIVVCAITLNLHILIRNGPQPSQNYNLKPFAGLSIMWNNPDRHYALVNVLGNITMFMPFGFLLPLLWRNWSGLRVFLAAIAFSAMIETVQFFSNRGTDIVNVNLNALGAGVG